MRALRLFLAFLTAAAVVVFAIPAADCIGSFVDRGGFGSCVKVIAFYGLFGFIIVIPAVTFIGAPLFFLFYRKGLIQWWQVGVCGALVGLATALAVLFLEESSFVWHTFALVSVPLGFIGGLAFWLVGVFRNLGPNNSFKPKPLRGSA